MNVWPSVLIFGWLAQCCRPYPCSCPLLCICAVGSSGAEVACEGSSLTSFPPCGLPPNATRLSVRNTSINTVTAAHLSAVPLLNTLQMYQGKLAELPPDLLEAVPDLQLLDLTGNRLVLLPPDIFRHASLEGLVLKNNELVKADANWFPDNSSLTWLDLSGNRLTDVPSGLLRKLPNLVDLDLSDNGLQEVRPDAFRNQRRLRTLNLAGNKLRLLEASVFSGLDLFRLFLQENQLEELPADLLRGLPDLELLMLNRNGLRRLPPGLLDRCASLRLLLSGNPWLCDEEMEYLWRWLTAHPQNVFFLEEVTCAGPEALRGRRVATLTRSELGLQR